MTIPQHRILAIDDTPANLITLGAALADEFDLQFATSGQQGLVLAAESTPDLILLDVMMPEMDGYEVCRRLKADDRLKTVPVIFVTALCDVGSESKGLELGAADYLTKPINVELARKRIRNLLERENLRREVERHRDQLEEQVRQRTLSLSVAKEAADGANLLQQTILANISHEFRTPMNGILGMIALAKLRVTEPKVLDYLDKAESSAHNLLVVLNGLLDLAASESARLTVDLMPFVVADVFDKIRQEFAAPAQAKGIGLELKIEEGHNRGPVLYLGDPLRIQQIVFELVRNALNFSERGAITVITSIQSEAEKPTLVSTVSDQGIGIAANDLHRIFEPFQQVDGSVTRQFGGNGIGLTLCRRLARLMGGDITVTSSLGKGSTFTLRIPLAVVDAAGVAALVSPDLGK